MRDKEDFCESMLDKGYNIKVEHLSFDMYLKEIDTNIEELIKEYCKTFINKNQKAINVCRYKGLQETVFYYNSIYITEVNAPKVLDIHLRSKEYVLDHIIPLSYGFEYGIDPYIMGHENNLQIITNLKNLIKSNRITDQVQDKLKEFNLTNLNPIEIYNYDIKLRRYNPTTRVYKERLLKPNEINYYTKEMELLQTELL